MEDGDNSAYSASPSAQNLSMPEVSNVGNITDNNISTTTSAGGVDLTTDTCDSVVSTAENAIKVLNDIRKKNVNNVVIGHKRISLMF